MRLKRTTQTSLYEPRPVDHPLGGGLEAISNWLDAHPELLDEVAAGLGAQSERGRGGLTCESIPCCAAAGAASQIKLLSALPNRDLAAVEAEFRAICAAIPADWHRRNDIAHFEGYYASVFYSCLAALGFDLSVEDASAAGRADLALRCDGRVYLFEFKVIERAGGGAALQQLRERGYAEKYRASGEPVHLIGVEFSEESRNITAFEFAEA